jgi:muramoyltetrapeptide carboxypeptidase LdcA involved in peptidoglycan recycling
MSLVGVETTIPLFERAKMGHALDSTAIVIGYNYKLHV